ncbi:hypothetical protein [Sphingobacterium bovistauri]|uniref:Glycosyl hydrolase family 30 TIM-barrel domain-containing protein n=1 Tax=Sphingobacterium bovistauri TaxID=2781959 RepID=A0ABS7Z3C0_9SPHI|nr:hypothetical protein [Sphingobacterium bovistauri]MCA5004642.1 hypothetical protein [Sphingobacterium bovistauri]
MMNRFFGGTLFLILLSLIFGCKKTSDTNDLIELRFQENEISLSSEPGAASFTIIWKNTEWEIQTVSEGFLSNFNFLKGGSFTHNSSTRVEFKVSENLTSSERSQIITLKNVLTGESTEFTVKQAVKPPVILKINSNLSYQNITGFGGMLNPALWQGGNQLTTNEIDQLYGTNGLGYKMLRMMIYPNSNDWSRDLAIAKKAQSLGVRIFASPWSPPAHMKSSKQQGGGNRGYLLPEYYEDYAKHLNAFVDYMTANGVTIEAVSIQNEPDWDPDYDACVWTGQQILNFIKNHGKDIKVKIIAAEAVNFKKEYTDSVLQDPVAREHLDIIGTHLYGGGIGDYPLARQYNKEIWMTEHLMNNNNANDWSWNDALVFGKELHGCMEANFNAYIWWYLKRHYSMIGDGEHGTTKGQIMHRGYVLSHYAKYATGRRRIAVDKITNNANVFITAYEGVNDVTLVVQNQSDTVIPALQFDLPVTANSASAEESTATKSMQVAPISVSANKQAITCSLQAKSIISIRINK